ncbi:Flp pilus assembly protein CpaB [Cytobacillus sp. FJAT-54145]|uniref:Flp pilus assembly protein CpaB n=1 Tax=Cytobacillus spartinae TaxID=3299023 RepID=A0ABW6K9J8_9BACI
MKSKLIMFIALLMGVFTTFLFFNYMKKFDTTAVINENTVEVLVAKEAIKENQRITSSMVELAQLPKDGVHPQTLTDLSTVEGKYATSDIEAGEALLTHRIKSEKEEALFVSRKVKEGFRGVSVGVNFVQSISNLIEPEDVVDVIFSEVVKVNDKDTVVSKQILSKVRVLAIGRKMIATTDEAEEYAEYSSLTLELSPEDSLVLVNASERGHIHFTLHTKIESPKK